MDRTNIASGKPDNQRQMGFADELLGMMWARIGASAQGLFKIQARLAANLCMCPMGVPIASETGTRAGHQRKRVGESLRRPFQSSRNEKMR
jgi:hypothetical protein